MKRREVPILILIILSLASCVDDGIPPGLYRDQVIRLLTNDSSKVWTSATPFFQECTQPDQWIFSVDNDSVIYRSIATSCADNTIQDTTNLGVFQPSFLQTGFTDSLLFEDGSFWLVSFISSQEFTYIDPVHEETVSLISEN